MGELIIKNSDTHATPPSGKTSLYPKEDKAWYAKDDTGTETELGGGGGTPDAHAASHQNGGSDEISVAGLSGALADTQTPSSHATAHQSGGGDSIKIDDLAAPDDNTDLNVSISAHGLCPKLSNNSSEYLNGVGGFSSPTVGAAERVNFPIRKASVGTIAKGKAVYVVSWNVAGYLEVEAAKSDSSGTMPAFAITNESITNSSTGYGILSGDVLNFDTSSWSVGDALYVSSTTAGELTSTKPTGTNAIQKIAQVARSHGSNGQVVVFGAGRSNDVPNIPEGDVWVGNSSGVATPSSLEALTTKFQFFMDQVQLPLSSDWAVNENAAIAADSNNSGLTVARFDDSAEEGIGFILQIPDGAVNIKLTMSSRAESAPGSTATVALTLYERECPDNAAVSSWSSEHDLTDISLPTNEHWQIDTQTIALSTLGLTAGRIHQFQLDRDTPDAADDLSGDWTLLFLKVEFS